MTPLERRYRWLLRAYPPGHRAGHGDEMIATLLAADAGRRVPSSREALALVAGGLRARALDAGRVPCLRDGTHLGVTALAAMNVGVLLPYAGSVPVWTALAAAALLAVTRGRIRTALLLVALVGAKVVAVVLGRPWLDETLLPVFPDAWWRLPALYSTGGPVAPVAAYALAFLGLLALAARRVPVRTRTWRWWLVAPLVAGADPSSWLTVQPGSAREMARVGLEVVLLCLAVWAGRVAADPRWAVAAALAVTPVVVACVENALVGGYGYVLYGRQELSHLGVLVLLIVVAGAAPLRARRRVLL
ncbi:hypothetical protein Ssi03_43940 [Sphaerisporangium siamense]|uniref:Uncharacterized protein n=1 Tax=Sphaerisporangium siamense TaxID=795645 RepID=A0A7W7GEG6_9ACTN|nr:hypothetical protein [Sphaerisporangium siamense]MBB4705444.1 hypothetical protein [Sphaerisporangium siamense]GII86404.1 hypothetical protein Ssi03_43940 [Sphaerisporangium siamense]